MKKNNAIGKISGKFSSNPMLFFIIIFGIIGLFFPFLDWWLVEDELPKTNLETLANDVKEIRAAYKKVEDIIEKIVDRESYRWKLSKFQRELLKKLSKERKNPIAEFFKFILFLIQGGFFFLLGVLIERKLLNKKRKLKNKVKNEEKEVKTENIAETDAAKTDHNKTEV